MLSNDVDAPLRRCTLPDNPITLRFQKGDNSLYHVVFIQHVIGNLPRRAAAGKLRAETLKAA